MKEKLLKFFPLYFPVLFGLAFFFGKNEDFRVYYDAASRFLESGWANVYDPKHLTPFKYHPFILYLCLPFSFLPWPAACALWAALNAWCLKNLFEDLKRHYHVSDRALVFSILMLTHALAWLFKYGNVSLLLTWLLIKVARADLRTHLRALALSLLILLKPFWIALLPLLMWHKTLNKRHWSILVQSGLLLLLFSALVFLSHSNLSAFRDWLAVLSDPVHEHNYSKLDNQSFFGFLARLKLTASLRQNVWLFASALIYALWLWRSAFYKNEKTHSLSLITVTLLVVWMGPLSWIHHQVFLIPFFALIFSRPFDRAQVLCLAIFWLLVNGSGQALIGREWSHWVHAQSLPLWGLSAVTLLFAYLNPAFIFSSPPRKSP